MLATCMLLILSACGGSGETTFGNSDDPFISDASIQELAESLGFITPIAYVRREVPDVALNSLDDFANLDPVERLDLDAFNPGASLWIRSGASISANEFNISAMAFGEDASYDVKNISVSPNGEKIVFAMHAPEDDPDDPQFTWNIWEFDLVTNTLTQVIPDTLFPDSGHDINPIYLSNNDILFSSTRQEKSREVLSGEGKIQFSSQEEDSARNANEPSHTFNLHILHRPEGGVPDIEQITFNQSHDFSPVKLPGGKILYSRWDNANNDQVSFYEINIDGSAHQLKYGYHSLGDPGATRSGHLSQPRIAPNHQVIAIAHTDPALLLSLGGDIVSVDIDNFIDLNTPTFSNAGLTTQAVTSLSPNTVTVGDALDPSGRYLSAWPLHDGSDRILVSWADCQTISLSDPTDLLSPLNNFSEPCSLADNGVIPALPAFQIWMLDPSSGTQKIIVQAVSGQYYSEVVAMEAISFADEPTATIDPLLVDEAILNIRSIYDLDGVDIATPNIADQANPGLTDPDTIEAKFLRLVKAVSIPDEDVLDFDNDIFGVSSNQLMRELVGYVPIEPDGSVRAIVPANVPLMFSVVDRTGKRINIENANISQRHDNWIHLTPGTTLQCQGCHARNSEAPHGRIEAQAPSVHAGGTVSIPYPNTEPLYFAPDGGETMAEIYASANSIAGHRPAMDLIYTDVWTDDSGSLVKATPFSINYADLNDSLTLPVTSACNATWGPFCRITINYEEHIQPIWELSRTPIDDGSGMNLVDTCVGCHTTNGGTQVPSAQLDLTSNPSDVNAAHFSSYQELLRADVEQVLNGGSVANRLWECNVVDPLTNLPVDDPASDPMAPTPLREFRDPNTIPASMSEAGASFGASDNFFTCLTQDNACRDNIGDTLPAAFPDECIEFAGDPVISQPTINHNGLLSPAELRLVSEWLDIGAQYYNNPFDAP